MAVGDKMLDKDPNNWFAFFQLIPESVQGAIMAFIISIARLIWDSKEPSWVRRISEAFICAFLAYSLFHLTKALGMSSNFAFFGSVFLGFLGADYVREKAKLWFGKRLDN